MFAIDLLCQANKTKYGHIIQYLENQFVLKNDVYPTDAVEAPDLLLHYKRDGVGGDKSAVHPVADSVLFVTAGADSEHESSAKKDKKGKKKRDIRCYICESLGHTSHQCTATVIFNVMMDERTVRTLLPSPLTRIWTIRHTF